MNPQSTTGPQKSVRTTTPSQPRRKPWVAPRLTAHGSLKHLVRGATGHFGDQATPFGKRNIP